MAYVATPIVALLDGSSTVLLRLFGIRSDQKEGVTEEEVRA